ncbi:MAG: Ser/Thr protein kinase RdoA (MazF antagonist) [Candidatus Latescibacterota bacterium]|jgi:Ser/Thr protein kinase RdoA (MazF antagonist)
MTALTAFSVPSAQALNERVLCHYVLATPVRCDFLHFGVNETYRVSAAVKTYFLRLYRRGWRSRGEILAEVDMLLYLHRRRLPVSYPIKRSNGSYLTRVDTPEGVRYAVLFSAAPGKNSDLNFSQCSDYGELTARLHLSLDQRKRDTRRFDIDVDHLVRDPLRTIAHFLEQRPQDLGYLREMGEACSARVEGLLSRSAPEYGSCHGDHHGGNLHVDAKGGITLFDFDCYGYGWRAYDIAVFRWIHGPWEAGASRAQKAKKTRTWNAFISGYERVRTLSKNERLAVDYFVVLRQIWLMGLHTQGAYAWGSGWINDGYFDHHIAYIKRFLVERKLF